MDQVQCFSTCPSQADDLLNDLEDKVKESIKNDYGRKDDVTALWNTTMEEVLYYQVISVRNNFITLHLYGYRQ